MISRLFMSGSSHGRTPSSLESTTEEEHTRRLLFPEGSPSSSPLLPFQAPVFRPGTFDDHDGLELEEKDIRILVAQDAYADQERPSVLFDTASQKGDEAATKSPVSLAGKRHERTASGLAASKSYFGLQIDSNPSFAVKSPGTVFQMRNRSSTVSGSFIGPSTPNLRDVESRDATNDLLECMFGSTSSTKSGTRMHIFKAGSKGQLIPTSPLVSPTAWNSKPRRNPPLVRAQTLGLSNPETGRAVGDVVLITRIFTVAPPESAKDSYENTSATPTTVPEDGPEEPSVNASVNTKRPKLREKKTPSYGVSLVITLPARAPSRPASRHVPRSEDAIHSPPASSSYGSDMQSSWTFLDALPPSLTSSQSFRTSVVDSHVNYLLRRWDTIVRHLSALEREAREKIFTLLGQVEETSNGPKTPKEKKMQRINQRIVRLPAFSLSHDQDLAIISHRAIQHVRSAVSIPPVKPLHGGHWLEEARLIARLCNDRGNERFLAILMTAFLGTHFEWIDELSSGPHRKRLLLKKKSRQDQSSMRSRTVIICEDRSVARRLVFLLASFLFPGMHSLRSTGADTQSSRRGSRRDPAMQAMANRVNAEISTSFSSTDDDRAGRLTSSRPLPRFERQMSETSSLRTTANLSIPIPDSSFRKSSAGTTTTVTPNPSTPLAYIASTSKEPDSYFAIDSSVGGSTATASLQRLRRSSSTVSSGPSTWGSLLGSFWGSRQNSSASTSNMIFPSEAVDSSRAGRPISQSRTSKNSKLEEMACQVGTDRPSLQVARNVSDDYGGVSASPSLRTFEKVDIPPRLQVDERDGVVDVDLNLPGVLDSYGSSPFPVPSFATPMSTSTASLDGAASLFSIRSNPKTYPDPINNIAGYLKQYHPDFVLQAVRSYSEADLKASMSAEPDQGGMSPESGGTVCSTLIADARSYTVKRLTLKREVEPFRREPAGPAPRSAKHGKFMLENVHSYDETLAGAIERALDRPSAIPSRIPSPSPSKSRHNRTVSNSTTSTSKATPPRVSALSSSLAKDSLQPIHVSQRNRGQFILDALKEVVVEVDRDLHSSQDAQNISSTPTPGSAAGKNQKKEENALREGVKRWLQEAEEMNVW